MEAEDMKVLVVDDSRSMRLVVGSALRRAGHEVLEACDGVAALEALEACGPGRVDCVVCDLYMPRMDGLTFLRQLRGVPECERTPVIMLTTESGAGAVDSGEAAGVRAWIVKPFRAEQLVEAVASSAAGS
jgi:two-component system chemotaxis response regulator CheY